MKRVILRIAWFLDFVHRPVVLTLENTTFRKVDLFPSSDEGGETPSHLSHLLHLSKGPNCVGVFPLPSSKDGNKYCFLVSRIPNDGRSPKTQQF
jgi:hypothetical protein